MSASGIKCLIKCQLEVTGEGGDIYLQKRIRCLIHHYFEMITRHQLQQIALLYLTPLHWRHDERDGVSNHQPHDYMLNCLFRLRSKKSSKLCVTGLCAWNSSVTGDGIHRWPVNSTHRGSVTRKMFPFDEVIMRPSCEKTSAVCAYSVNWM